MSKFYRKKYLIEPEFQISYAIKLSVTSTIMGFVTSAIIYSILQNLALDLRRCEKFVPFLSQCLEKQDYYQSSFLLPLAIFILATMIFTFIWGILITHRIAGPVYVLKNAFKTMKNGEFPSQRPLRDQDFLKDVYAEFNELSNSLRDKDKDRVETIEGIQSTINGLMKDSSGPVSDELKTISAKLDQIK